MSTSTRTEQSIETVRTFAEEVFNGRNYDRLEDVQAADYVQHGPMPGMELRGTEASLETMKQFHAAFSDLEANEDLTFSDGDYVCTHYTYTGTHDGDLMGLPATDETAEVRGIVINKVEDGKISEGWVVVDFLALFQQLGLIPEDFEQMGT